MQQAVTSAQSDQPPTHNLQPSTLEPDVLEPPKPDEPLSRRRARFIRALHDQIYGTSSTACSLEEITREVVKAHEPHEAARMNPGASVVALNVATGSILAQCSQRLWDQLHYIEANPGYDPFACSGGCGEHVMSPNGVHRCVSCRQAGRRMFATPAPQPAPVAAVSPVSRRKSRKKSKKSRPAAVSSALPQPAAASA